MKNIYVSNLDLKTTAESLRAFFEPVGTVHNLKLMLDRITSLSRGFAFIEMTDPEADRAIAALNGRSLDGRVIDIHEGRPKLHRGASRVIQHGTTPDHSTPGDGSPTDTASLQASFGKFGRDWGHGDRSRAGTPNRTK